MKTMAVSTFSFGSWDFLVMFLAYELTLGFSILRCPALHS